jgi:hypothetical protein
MASGRLKGTKNNVRQNENASRQFLSTILGKATFAEKLEVVRAVNPYFYLLTPKPKEKRA